MADWSPRRLVAEGAPSRAFVAAAVAAWVLLTAIVAVHHESWRDEADAWLFARDGDFAHIVEWSRHAGTPTRRDLVPMAIIAAGALLAWWQVRTPPDPMRIGAKHLLQWKAIPWTIANAFAPTLPMAIGCSLGGLLLILMTIALRRSPAALAGL